MGRAAFVVCTDPECPFPYHGVLFYADGFHCQLPIFSQEAAVWCLNGHIVEEAISENDRAAVLFDIKKSNLPLFATANDRAIKEAVERDAEEDEMHRLLTSMMTGEAHN